LTYERKNDIIIIEIKKRKVKIMKTIDKENYEVMQNNPYAEDLTIALY
jgi:hypothetical protein